MFCRNAVTGLFEGSSIGWIQASVQQPLCAALDRVVQAQERDAALSASAGEDGLHTVWVARHGRLLLGAWRKDSRHHLDQRGPRGPTHFGHSLFRR